ncbi:avidin-related protein 3-like [Engraulis encrasicolus]|uniref:avidin-related protein 3-like n=1 Tax=Engraulis encrasicolus TaxID=184585 RepID=UPI002FD1064A
MKEVPEARMEEEIQGVCMEEEAPQTREEENVCMEKSPVMSCDATPMECSCNVTGHWRNELGSDMQLTAKDSSLQGWYKTAVGTIQKAALTGFVSAGVQPPTVSFSVLWKEGGCTSWVGQCFVLPTGDCVLKTIWMLRSVAEGPDDNWTSTRVGADTFSFVGAC